MGPFFSARSFHVFWAGSAFSSPLFCHPIASGTSRRSSIYKGEGPLIYRTNRDLEESILRISGKVAYRIKVALSGKGLANFISSRQ